MVNGAMLAVLCTEGKIRRVGRFGNGFPFPPTPSFYNTFPFLPSPNPVKQKEKRKRINNKEIHT